MTRKTPIKLIMPDLSPKAAYAFSQWMSELARQVEDHYTDEIRSHMYTTGRDVLEMDRIEAQIELLEDLEEDPDDPIPF